MNMNVAIKVIKYINCYRVTTLFISSKILLQQLPMKMFVIALLFVSDYCIILYKYF